MIGYQFIPELYHFIDDHPEWPRLLISHQLSLIKDIQEKAYKVLFAGIISLRTKEKVTWEASIRLFERYPSLISFLLADSASVAKLIYPAGFYKTKSENLIKISRILEDKYNLKIPSSLDELLVLPGVGRKVANLVLIEAFDLDGICVDTHVHRLSNLWGWVNTQKPDETEMQLRLTLPQKYWKSINRYLVLFGQNICLPKGQKCNLCLWGKKCSGYRPKS